MNDRTVSHPFEWAAYWRNSLADAELATGALPAKNDKLYWQSTPELNAGVVDSHRVTSFFQDIAPEQELVEVTIRPFVFALRREHGKKIGNLPETVAPIMVKASMDRAGKLYPEPLSGLARDLLEPQERAAMTIAALEDVDQELNNRPVNGYQRPTDDDVEEFDYIEAWQTFLAGCRRLLKNTAKDWPGDIMPYQQRDGWLIGKVEDGRGSSLHILPLYDHMQSSKKVPPLFAQYAAEANPDVAPRLAPNAGFAARLAHASDQYPLADAQRDGLAHFLATRAGDILAVNGPPGTGKTTLLLSVVACLWAKAAADGGDPPVIVAASTNNQAVTNIIDAFGKDFSSGSGPFAGRWLPKIKSFGAYFPAKTMEEDSARKYQTKEFFSALETPQYVEDATKAFLAKVAVAYPHSPANDIDVAVALLQADIRARVEQLERLERSWTVYLQAREALTEELGADPEATQAERVAAATAAKCLLESLKRLHSGWDEYLHEEPFYLVWLSWIKAIGRKRLAGARHFITTHWPEVLAPGNWETIEAIDDSIAQAVSTATSDLLVCDESQRVGALAILVHKRQRDAWRQAAACLFPNVPVPENVTLADCDQLADTRIRFPVFLLTTHYWEGRWLMAMAELLPKLAKEAAKTGRTTAIPRWHRRMMLTPTVVATCYMLPHELKVGKFENNAHTTDYLYNFADLLIIDEAGQVLPEVAGASFALAQRALVIGDTLQLEPIWKLPPGIDAGNLRSAGMLSEGRTYQALRTLGKTAAGGSAMAIAQQRSRYHYDPDFPRGMMLYEHRRCYDQIIGYCNDLCYHGKLIPKRGEAPADGDLPTMGYLHINGRSEMKPGQSRWNLLEADTIAAWIAQNRAALETRYNKKIHEIIGVLSPFTGQVGKIIDACDSLGLPAGRGEGDITVGTVNALQGAERPIVIFSPAYSKHSDGQFIDKRQSMLNVAVSRAKDHFLVFGDMDIFNPRDRQKPRGLLADKLFGDPRNALDFEALPRKDLCFGKTGGPRYLRDAAEHDRFLLEAIAQAKSRLVIVSPWLRRQRIEAMGIHRAMAGAIKRGVSVAVFGSRGDTDHAIAGEWQSCVDFLAKAGIVVNDVDRLHAKILMADDHMLAIGSFNWLSAAREGPFAKHEVSAVYAGSSCAEEIAIELEWLEKQAGGLGQGRADHPGGPRIATSARDGRCDSQQEAPDAKQHRYRQPLHDQ